jgi:hypothetical protein
LTDATRFSSIQLRATSSSEDTSSVQGDDVLADLKQKVSQPIIFFESSHIGIILFTVILYFSQWDALENKSTVLLYGGGAIVAVWISSIVVSAVNSVPLVQIQWHSNKQNYISATI